MENEKKLGQNSAFPIYDSNTILAVFNSGGNPLGMSKRFYAACMAMQGILSGTRFTSSIAPNSERIAKDAYAVADEILKQENL